MFCNRKETVDTVTRSLHDSGHRTVALRGGIQQSRREEALEDFRKGVYDIMVATNVAARGLDIKGVKLVVNYDMPDSLELYIHRIGREVAHGGVRRRNGPCGSDGPRDFAGDGEG